MIQVFPCKSTNSVASSFNTLTVFCVPTARIFLQSTWIGRLDSRYAQSRRCGNTERPIHRRIKLLSTIPAGGGYSLGNAAIRFPIWPCPSIKPGSIVFPCKSTNSVAYTAYHVATQELVPSWFKSVSYGVYVLFIQFFGIDINPAPRQTPSKDLFLPITKKADFKLVSICLWTGASSCSSHCFAINFFGSGKVRLASVIVQFLNHQYVQ